MIRNNLPFICIVAGLTAWVAAGQHDPFLWDSVQLGSKHAHFFYENDLKWAPLPAGIDSGHPPVFGYYLAVIWSCFGKSLPVSHWAMLPFLAATAWLALRLGRRLGGAVAAYWLLPVLFLDPVFAGQSTLVAPDVVLACCFLLGVEGLLGQRKIWVALAVLGLCAISTRGMMTAAALFTWQALASRRPDIFFQPGRHAWLAFVPGVAFAAWFLSWHYFSTGWIGFHAESPWAPAFAPAHGWQLLRNAAVIGWRWTDLGRIFEWLVLAYLLFQPRVAIFRSALFLLLVCLVLFLTPSALIYNNLSAHRYFLPLFIGIHLLVYQALTATGLSNRKKIGWFCVLIAGLGTGNCWIYPRGISMDWDATLAYLPYHRLRANMVEYLDRRQIDFKNVGSDFPNINTGEILLLNNDLRAFSERDFNRNGYILASNVFNDLTPGDFRLLEQNWQRIRRLEHAGIWMELYRKRE